MAFYIILQQVQQYSEQSNFSQPILSGYKTSFVGVETKDDHEFFFFNAPVSSFFKTLGMFVGELEYSDLPIDASSPISIVTLLFLTLFVFVVMIVQMNLLNGLAVADVGELQKNAQIGSIKAR